MISLCERCANNDWAFADECIKPALADAGVELKSVWCKATDRPEDERWGFCPNFKEMTFGEL